MGPAWLRFRDLICVHVRVNCLMKAESVPNPGREGESERSLVRAQGLSSGRNAGICIRGSASPRLYCGSNIYLCSCLETDVMKRDKPEPRSVNLSKTVYRSLHVFVGDGGQSCVVDVLQPPCSAQTVISV